MILNFVTIFFVFLSSKLRHVSCEIALNISHIEITIYNEFIGNGTHEIPLHISYPRSLSNGPYPLVIFMHGDPCEWWWYEYLSTDLSEKGYIVALVAPEEPAGPPPIMSLDMKYALDYLINISLHNDTIQTTQTAQTTQTTQTTHDTENTTSTTLNTVTSTVKNPFYPNKISVDKTCACGHSAGSDASILSGNKDWEYPFIYSFKSIIGLAPFVDEDILSSVNNWNGDPILMLSGSDDCICPPVASKPIFNEFSNTDNINANNACRYYVEITNGTHCDFADIEVIDNVCDKVELATCTREEKDNRNILDREIQLELTKEYVYQFLQTSLIEKTQEAYDNLYQLFKSQTNGNGDGYVTYLEYNCTLD